MNKTLKEFAKSKLVEYLDLCTPEQQKMFKWMYGRNNGARSLENAEAMTNKEVVSEVKEDRLSHAMDQCERTIENNKKQSMENKLTE